MSVYKLCFSVSEFKGPAFTTLLEDGVAIYHLTRPTYGTIWSQAVPTSPAPAQALFTSTSTPRVEHYIWFNNATSPTRCYYSTDGGTTIAHTFVVGSDALGVTLILASGNAGDTNSHYNCAEGESPASHRVGDTYTDNGSTYKYTFWSEEGATEQEYFPELCRFDNQFNASCFYGTGINGYDSFRFRCFADHDLIDSNVSISSIVATVDESSTVIPLARLSSGSDYWETNTVNIEQPVKTVVGVGACYVPHTVKFTATFSDNTTRESDTYYFVSLLKNGPTTPEKHFYQGVYDGVSHRIWDIPTSYYDTDGSLVNLSGEGTALCFVPGKDVWTDTIIPFYSVVNSVSQQWGYVPVESNVLFYGDGAPTIEPRPIIISDISSQSN